MILYILTVLNSASDRNKSLKLIESRLPFGQWKSLVGKLNRAEPKMTKHIYQYMEKKGAAPSSKNGKGGGL